MSADEFTAGWDFRIPDDNIPRPSREVGLRAIGAARIIAVAAVGKIKSFHGKLQVKVKNISGTQARTLVQRSYTIPPMGMTTYGYGI
jgi:hypothetical protein